MAEGPPGDAAIRRWIAQVGRTDWSLVMRLAAAVWAAARTRGEAAPDGSAVCSLYRRGLRIAYRDPVALADLAVDGDDLRAAGVPTGPDIGRMLQTLLDIVVEDPSRNTRAELLRHVTRGQS
jgi:hypothetical protein